MIRPVGLLDIPLINRLQDQGVHLDPKRSLTRPESAVVTVLRAPLALYHVSSYTYLARVRLNGDSLTGFVQLCCRPPGCTEADVTFIAPGLSSEEHAGKLWTTMLDVVSRELGQLGIQRIYASLPADSDDAVPFLNAGFMIFAREELLGHTSPNVSAKLGELSLRPVRKEDHWSLQRLYSNIVPFGVKQAEGLCDSWESYNGSVFRPNQCDKESHVAMVNGELLAHVEIFRGRIGNWIHFTLHPHVAERAGELVDAGLRLLVDDGKEPVYCHVRTYESIVRPALLDRGFDLLGRRDLMVRQTLARIQQPALVGKRVVDARAEVPAAPTLLRSTNGINGEREIPAGGSMPRR